MRAFRAYCASNFKAKFKDRIYNGMCSLGYMTQLTEIALKTYSISNLVIPDPTHIFEITLVFYY